MARSSPQGVLQAHRTDRHIRMDDDGQAVEVVDVRQRFGGIDVGASIAGALAALGVTVLLGGIAGSIGTVGYQLDVERGTDALSAGGLVTGLVVLLAAFLIGGWVAGRIARYDGGKNGVLTAAWFIALAAVLASAGAWLGDKYDVFQDLQVPQWFSSNATTAGAIVTGVIAAGVMLAAGFLGGILGARTPVPTSTSPPRSATCSPIRSRSPMTSICATWRPPTRTRARTSISPRASRSARRLRRSSPAHRAAADASRARSRRRCAGTIRKTSARNRALNSDLRAQVARRSAVVPSEGTNGERS